MKYNNFLFIGLLFACPTYSIKEPPLKRLHLEHSVQLSSAQNAIELLQLPRDMIKEILYKLRSIKELGNLARANKTLRDIVYQFNAQDYGHLFENTLPKEDLPLLANYLDKLSKPDLTNQEKRYVFTSFLSDRHLHESAVNAIIVTSKRSGINGEEYIGNAVCTNYTAVIQALLNSGVSIDHTNYLGQTPLIIACLSGQKEVVSFLLDKGADVSKPDALLALSIHPEIKILICQKYNDLFNNDPTQLMDSQTQQL